MSLDLVKNYNKALQDIYDHVGFTEDYVICPLDDCTERFWDTNGETVFFADTEQELETRDGNYYEDEVYTQRFYNKWMYEGKDFTMIFCNPQTDGMRWFRLFDNSKRRPFKDA
jgi:hypothetical protein